MIKSNDILKNKIHLLLRKFFTELQIDEVTNTIENKTQSQANASAEQFDKSTENIDERKFIDGVITYSKNNLDADIYQKLRLDLVKLLADSESINLAEEILINSVSEFRSDSYYAESILATADIFIRKAYWNNSTSLIKQAKKIFARLNNIDGLARCENLLGIIHGECGDLKKSRALFFASRNLLDHNSDKKFAAQIDSNIGIIENIVGNFSKAKEYLEDALSKFEALGDLKNVAEIWHNLGMLYFERKDYKMAIEEFDKAITISTKENFKTILAISYLGKANTLSCLKNYNDATEYAYKAMDTAIKIEDKLTIADVYRITGILERKLKSYKTAEKYFQISLRLNNELNNRLNFAETSFELGLLNSELGNEKEKNHWFQKSLDYYNDIGANDKVKLIEDLLNGPLN